MKHRL